MDSTNGNKKKKIKIWKQGDNILRTDAWTEKKEPAKEIVSAPIAAQSQETEALEKTVPLDTAISHVRAKYPGMHIGIDTSVREHRQDDTRFPELLERALGFLNRVERGDIFRFKIAVRACENHGELVVRVGKWEGDAWHGGYFEEEPLDSISEDAVVGMIRNLVERQKNWSRGGR